MSETLPRWNLPAVDFLETDPAKIESQIITRYENASGRSLAAGDPVRLFLLAIAAEIIQLRTDVNIAARQNLLSYAQNEHLDALGVYMSTDRLSDSRAVTTIRFSLSEALGNDYTIPAGFEVTNGVVTFSTDDEVIIRAGDMTGEVSAQCTEAGEAGNDYLPGQISTIVTPMTFLASAENITITSGGADKEDDPEYADRIRLAPNSFSVAGPKKAYIFHAYSVSSAIIDVSVTSPSPGEVKVYPLLTGGTLPTDDVLDQVEDYLMNEEIRPLTDFVEVLAPKAVEYTINVDFWIVSEDKTKSDAIRAAVDKAVEEYRLWQQSKIGRDILPARLVHNIIAAGAARIDAATMTPATFTELADDEVAQCTGVTVTYKGYKDE